MCFPWPVARTMAALLPLVCALAAPWSALRAEGAPGPVLDIEAYDVDGSTLLPQATVEEAVYPYLGPGRTPEDVEHARAALEKAFHDRGYQSVVVEVPVQNATETIIRLHVVEAPVGRLRVTGTRNFSPEEVRRQVPALREGEVPNITLAQQQITDANRLPDRRVTPLVKAGAAPGTVDVELKVAESSPLHIGVELNNDHNQDTEPLRLITTARYDNLFQLGHSVSLTWAIAPQNPNNSNVVAGSYLAPIWGSPWSLLIYGYNSNSDVATLSGSNVLGKGYAIGQRAVLQLPRSGDLVQSISFGFDYKNFAENVLVSAISSSDTVQYVPFTAAYNLQRTGPRFETRLQASVTAGVRGLGSGAADFENKRFESSANFVHVNLDLSQTENVGLGFQAAQRLTAQVADQPLVSSEQFAIGGLRSVRGYLQSEAVGDDGFSGSLEIITPSVAPRALSFIDDMRFLFFTDGGVVSILDPLPEQTSFFSLASAGLGLRFQVFGKFTGEVDLAMPFITGPATRANDPRATFSVKSDF